MAERITIPDEAWQAGAAAFPHGIFWDRYEPEIRAFVAAAAPLIVAADRQHLADGLRALTKRLDADGIDVSQDVEEIIGDLERTAAALRSKGDTAHGRTETGDVAR